MNRQEALDARSQGKEQTTIANVSLGVGALGLVAGGVLFFWPSSKEKSHAAPANRAGVTVAPTLGGAVLSGRF